MERLSKDCDVLVHMCHYLSGTALCPEFAESCMGHIELAELGEKANVKTLVITHVTEQIDQPGVRERVLREMAEIYKGNLDLRRGPDGDPGQGSGRGEAALSRRPP